MPKVALYCPQDRNVPCLECFERYAEVPAVGDLIYSAKLAPTAGPGASSYLFRVTSRMWGNTPRISLQVEHVWRDDEERDKLLEKYKHR